MPPSPNLTLEKWDVHHHFVPDFYVEAVKALGFNKLGGLAFPKWTAQASINLMRELHITKAFLSMPGVYFRSDSFSRQLARKCNDFMAQTISDHPMLFGGFGSVPLPDVNGALKELAYCFDTLKVDGLILMSSVDGVYLGQPEYREFFAELDQRRAVVFLHPTPLLKSEDHGLLSPIYWWQNDTALTLIHYIRSGYHRLFPNIRFILPHSGGPFPVLFPLIVAQLKAENPNIAAELEAWKPQLFLETASKGFDEQPPATLAFAGANHLLFGSDFPWANRLAARVIVDQYAHLDTAQGLQQSEVEGIFSLNAKRVFGEAQQIPHRAVSQLSKPYPAPSAPQPSTPIQLHQHCLPAEVAAQLDTQHIATPAMEVWDAQKALADMRAAHVEKAMLSLDVPNLWKGNSHQIAQVLHTYNAAAANIRAANPDKLGAFGAIDVNHRANALSELDHCLTELRLDGICLYTNISATPIDGFIDPVILSRLAEIRVPILVHPQDATGIPLVNPNYLDSLYFVIKAFHLGVYERYLANAQIFLAHTGNLVPYLAEPFNLFFYFQRKRTKVLPYLADTYINKHHKGYEALMRMTAV